MAPPAWWAPQHGEVLARETLCCPGMRCPRIASCWALLPAAVVAGAGGWLWACITGQGHPSRWQQRAAAGPATCLPADSTRFPREGKINMPGKGRPESSLLNMQCHMGVHFYVKRRKKKAYNKTHSYPALKDNLYWLPNPLPSSVSKQGHWNTFSADHSASHCTPGKKTSESPLVARGGQSLAAPPPHRGLSQQRAQNCQRCPHLTPPGQDFGEGEGSRADFLQHCTFLPPAAGTTPVWEQPHCSAHLVLRLAPSCIKTFN